MRIEEAKLQYVLYDNDNSLCGILAKVKENEKIINMIKLCAEIGTDMNTNKNDNK